MNVSMAQVAELTCSRCGNTFTSDIWVIVDGSACPDLLAHVREGTLHDTPCPHCEHQVQVDAPLLLYLPERDPPLLFSPARGTTQEQDHEHAAWLMGTMRKRLGDTWQDTWVANGLQITSREMLPVTLQADPGAALSEMMERAQQVQQTAVANREALAGLPSEERARALLEKVLAQETVALLPDDLDETFFQVLDAVQTEEQPGSERARQLKTLSTRLQQMRQQIQQARQAQELRKLIAEAGNLGKTLWEFLAADSWVESQHVLEVYPQLLTDEAEKLLERMIATVEAPEEARHSLLEHSTLLRRCREVGAETAFAEKMGRQLLKDVPEEIQASLQALATLPPEQRAALAGLFEQARETGVNTAEEMTTFLDAHPELRAVLNSLPRVERMPVPPELQPILDELSRLTSVLDMPRRVALCQQALQRVSREQLPELWAVLQAELGASLAQSPFDDHADNLERAIMANEQALEVWTRDESPAAWATAMMHLANVYSMRIRGDRAENLERAIEYLQMALEVTIREATPVEWATTTVNLGLIYERRIRGNRAENLEQAIECYQQALMVLTREKTPVRWAMAMLNLGNAYDKRIRGDRAENLEQAIECYRLALEVRTREAWPVEWAITMMNLAIVYGNRVHGDRAENLEHAIGANQQALMVLTREKMPVEWATTMMNLGSTYATRIRGDRAENLERAIECFQRALEVRTRSAMPVEWADAMMNLANAYRDRVRGDQAENLERAIEYYQQALEVRTREALPVEWATTMMNLGSTYATRIRGDRAENLERAIEYYQQALEMETRESMPRKWAMTMANLAEAFARRINGDQAENLERAIAAYQQALEVLTRDSSAVEWARAMVGLMSAYHRTENLEQALAVTQQVLEARPWEIVSEDWAQKILEMAIQAQEQSVAQMPPGSSQIPAHLNNLGVCLAARYVRTNNLEDLTRAVQSFEQAAAQLQPNSAARDSIFYNLGNSLSDLYTRTSDLNDLTRAIQAYEQAVTLTPTDSTALLKYLNRLGDALRDRYLRKGDLEDLEQAIRTWEDLVRQVPSESADLPTYLSHLGLGLRDRYTLTQDPADLERAIQFCEGAVKKTPPGSVDLSSHLNNLGHSLHARYKQKRKPEDLDRAVQAWEEAVQQALPDSSSLPMFLNNLGVGLSERFTQKSAPADLERAIESWEAAVRQSPPGYRDLPMFLNNLGGAYYDRFFLTKDPADLSESTTMLERACVLGLAFAPEEALRSARNWGAAAMGRAAWDEAARAYNYGLQSIEQLHRAQLRRRSKELWLREVQGMPARAAYALARLDRLQDAVVALEQGHARLLSEALERKQVELDALQAQIRELYTRYVSIVNRLQALETQDISGKVGLPSGQTLVDALRAAHADLDAVIDEIRAVPGHTDFLAAPDWNDVMASISPERPLVYFAVTPVGGVALLVQEKNVIPLWLNDLTESALIGQLHTWLDAYGSWLRASHAYMQAVIKAQHQGASEEQQRVALLPFVSALAGARAAWLTALDNVIRWLRDMGMATVTEFLASEGISHIVLIPAGLLGLLPLHAAASSSLEGVNWITFTYSPNARALSAAQAQAKRCSATATGLLAVDNPDGSLSFSRDEVLAALSAFPETDSLHLPGAAATSSAVRTGLSQYPTWHFATHGQAGWQQPLEGGLLLTNEERLTLRDLLAVKVSARLVVLSACETGIIGTELPDEVISLPTGLLQAGVAGVVGTLWAVNDFSTALLMIRFYEAWRVERLEPPEALALAQRWLRDSTNAAFAMYFKQHLPEFGGQSKLPVEVASDAYRRFRFADDQGARPFAHPFYWAGFYYTGV